MAINGMNKEVTGIDLYLCKSDDLNDFQKTWWQQSATTSDLAKKKLLRATNTIFGRRVAQELLDKIDSAVVEIKLIKSKADLTLYENMSIDSVKKVLRKYKVNAVKPDSNASKSDKNSK